MTKRLTAAIAAALVCGAFSGTSRAQEPCACEAAGGAGQPTYSGQPIYSGQPVYSGSAAPGSVIESGITGTTYGAPVAASTPSDAAQPNPYSYWSAFPNRARTYVEYGSVDQFPFYGRPYGSAGDRWSWYSMGGGNSRYLTTRYYQLLK